jgi:hypothetical protein
MTTSMFRETADYALNQIVYNLHGVTSQFGSIDFPDGGISFRNYMMRYPLGLFCAVLHCLEDEPTDDWAVKNGHKLKQLGYEPLIAIVGYCHLYTEGRKLFLSKWSPKGVAMTVSWLRMMYGLPEEVQMPFREAVAAAQFERYQQQADQLLHDGIATMVSIDTDDITWQGLAFAGQLAAPDEDNIKWQAHRDSLFAMVQES